MKYRKSPPVRWECAHSAGTSHTRSLRIHTSSAEMRSGGDARTHAHNGTRARTHAHTHTRARTNIHTFTTHTDAHTNTKRHAHAHAHCTRTHSHANKRTPTPNDQNRGPRTDNPVRTTRLNRVDTAFIPRRHRCGTASAWYST